MLSAKYLRRPPCNFLCLPAACIDVGLGIEALLGGWAIHLGLLLLLGLCARMRRPMRLVGLIHPVARLLEVCVECSLKNDRRRKVSLSLRKIPSGEAADPSRLWWEFKISGMSCFFGLDNFGPRKGML